MFEDLFSTGTSDTPEEKESAPGIPSYLTVLDTHTIANNNYSLLESVGYGGAAVVGAALTQTWNILPTIGNWLGGDFEQAKTKEVLQSFDDDVGKYYEGHQEGVDALGFALSSLVPGTGGIKLLRGGQAVLRGAVESGTFGAGLGKSLGLLAPSQPKLLSAAVETALKPNAGFPVWNAATVQSIIAGAGQAALEGAAFETAVAATMYNGPILDKQDFGDITSNILHGALLFGAVGGVTTAATTFHKIKGAGRAIDIEAMPYTHVSKASDAAPTSDKIVTLLDDLHTTPVVPSAESFGEATWKAEKFQSLREEKARYINNEVRTHVGTLTNGDQQLADAIHARYMAMDHEGSIAKAYGTTEITRLGETTAHEKQLAKATKDAAKTLDTEALEALPPRSTTYVKLAGEDAGIETATTPELVNISDGLKKGQEYSKAVTGYGEYLKKAFDPLTVKPQAAEARYVTALRTEFTDSTVVPATDIPYLQAAYNKGVQNLKVVVEDGSTVQLNSVDEIFSKLLEAKHGAATALAEKGASRAAISKIVDVNEAYLADGIVRGTEESNLVRIKTGEEFSQPQWAKQVKDTERLADIDNNVIEGMVALKQREKQYVEAAYRASANVLGEDTQKFIPLNADDVRQSATRGGVGGGFLSSQNENFGTLASKVQYIGAQTLQSVAKARDSVREYFLADLHALANNQTAAIEWEVLNSRLRSMPEAFTYDAGKGGMVPLRLKQYEEALASGQKVTAPEFAEGVETLIPVKNPETASLVVSHIEKNGQNLENLGAIRTNQGTKWNRDPQGFYPIPVNTKEFPHFAFVVDDTIAGAGHSKMINAADAAQLEKMITQVKNADPTLKVLTKGDAEAYYKSIGEYDYERTLTDLGFDAGLARKGVSAPYLVSTDPNKIISNFMNWHENRAGNLVREAVLHMNEPAVQSLRTLGEGFAKVNESHFSRMDPLAYVQMQEKNPYADYVKSMLGLSTAKDMPFWTPVNEMLDRKFSSVFASAGEALAKAKSPEELESINKMLQDAGYKGAAYDSVTAAMANHSAGQGALSKFVSRANAILANTMLRWDPINAVNNVVGSTVLLSTELKSVTRAIAEGNPDAVGALSKLLELNVPGTQDLIKSPGKLIANSIGRFHSDDGALMQFYKDHGFVSSVRDQYKSVLDTLTLTGKESAGELDSKISTVFAALKKGGDLAERVTGNKLAEEFNRFIAADVMKQITDVGVQAGVLGEKEALSYINTFVNRTQGNYIAAQRPGVFQGPVGQAIGLFQTYQFNLMQQLLRHVGEGSGKDAAMMLGMQSTIYGMKGLPAFDAINTHIIGNASGNTQHRDLYDSAYGALGKNAGDWLMYGAGSNALGLLSPELKMNLYTRGDINPRNVTLLPVNPADVPFVQASGKLWSSVSETVGKIAQGGQVWGSFLQGIEHAGVNRPLAGLAQSLQAFGNPMNQSYSTSNKGNVIMSNDMVSLANMIRVAGAKPMDEAIGIDRAYNISVYAAKDNELRNKLGETIKTAVIAGNTPSQEQVDKFSYEYAKAGGKQDKFAQFMLQQYKSANHSQVNELVKKVGSPASQSMQSVMGGYGLHDLTSQ